MKSDEKTKEAVLVERPWVKEAFEEIERLNQNPETRRIADFKEQELLDMLQREEDARKDGIELGIEQGRERANRETVISLYTNGMTTENIAKNVRLLLKTLWILLIRSNTN